MRKRLKILFWILALSLAVGLIIKLTIVLGDCSRGSAGGTKSTITVPRDTNFAPIEYQEYRPPILPFLSSSNKGLPAKLPQGVSEGDVKRVIRLKYKGIEGVKDLIELKGGEFYTEKDSTLESVTVTDYLPPVFDFDISFGLGLSVTRNSSPGEHARVKVSPVGSISFINILGVLRLPMFCADIDGAGIGAQYKLYHNVHLGLAKVWLFEDLSKTMLKATVQYNF